MLLQNLDEKSDFCCVISKIEMKKSDFFCWVYEKIGMKKSDFLWIYGEEEEN